MSIISRYVPDVEVYSIDEAFIKFNGFSEDETNKKCKKIIETILKWTGIPVSIGLAPTKSLAKVANRIAKKYSNKTDGFYSINTNEKRIKALRNISAGDIWGIGFQNEKKLSRVNVKSGMDFINLPDNWVKKNMSIIGLKLKKELEDVVLSKILITSTLVFLQTSSDVLYGMDLQTGETRWQKQAQAPLLSIRGTASPITYEGLIFTSFSNGRLAAIRALDGIQLWEKPISRLKRSTELEKLMDGDSNAIAVNEDVFASNYNGSLTRFNIRSGDKIFSVDHSTSKPIIFYKGSIVSINTDEEIVDKETILKQVWGYNPSVTTNTLETHIYRLRQKLEIDKSIPRLIISKGGGFKINQV